MCSSDLWGWRHDRAVDPVDPRPESANRCEGHPQQGSRRHDRLLCVDHCVLGRFDDDGSGNDGSPGKPEPTTTVPPLLVVFKHDVLTTASSSLPPQAANAALTASVTGSVSHNARAGKSCFDWVIMGSW